MPSAAPIAKPPSASGSSHSCGSLMTGTARLFIRARRGGALDQVRRERGPPGLMSRAEAAAVVAVEELVEQHEVLEERIVGVALAAAVTRPRAIAVAQEQR